MITWKDPNNEQPDVDRCVAAINYHNKRNWPLSAEIVFGIVEKQGDGFHVQSADCTGMGCYGLTFNTDWTANEIHAWAYATDFAKPDFLEHDPHFDMFKLKCDCIKEGE